MRVGTHGLKAGSRSKLRKRRRQHRGTRRTGGCYRTRNSGCSWAMRSIYSAGLICRSVGFQSTTFSWWCNNSVSIWQGSSPLRGNANPESATPTTPPSPPLTPFNFWQSPRQLNGQISLSSSTTTLLVYLGQPRRPSSSGVGTATSCRAGCGESVQGTLAAAEPAPPAMQVLRDEPSLVPVQSVASIAAAGIASEKCYRPPPRGRWSDLSCRPCSSSCR